MVRDEKRGGNSSKSGRDRDTKDSSPDNGRDSQLEGQPRSRPSSGAGRAFANPLLAEVAKLAKQKQLEDLARQNAAAEATEHLNKLQSKNRPSWRDVEEEGTAQEEERGDTRKRKHAPIVWNTQPENKAARLSEGIAHVESSSRLPIVGRTAAERAQAEVEEFRRMQAANKYTSDDEQDNPQGALPPSAYMKASPSVSSPEEEAHIRREGNSSHDLKESGQASPNSRQPSSRWGVGDGGEHVEQEELSQGPSLPLAAAVESGGGGDGYYPQLPGLGNEGEEVEAYPEVDLEDEEERENNKEEEEEEERVFVKRQVSMLNECRSVDKYERLNRISEGTYGVVYRARDCETGEICALKKVKLEKERDGFPLTSVREINVLLSLTHPNIVNVSEVVVGAALDSVYMVMEYADHDLKSVMDHRMRQPFTTAEVKCLMRQLLSGVAYLHENWVLHRDLKTSNILYTNRGQLKICDFGLARQYGNPLKPYTHLVVTLWYRAPELLLGTQTYSTAVDVWSVGCIMAELLLKGPLFQGKNELSQLDMIFKIMGTPTPATWPGVDDLPNFKKFSFKGSTKGILRSKLPLPGPDIYGKPSLSQAGFELLSGMLDLCPERRMTAQEALNHEWFYEHPLPKDQALMPTFPGTNESLHGHTHR